MKQKRLPDGLYYPTYRDKKTGEKKHSDIIWGVATVNGQKYRKSLHTTKVSVAKDAYHAWCADLGAGRIVTAAVERTSLADGVQILIDNYVVKGRKSVRRAKIATEHLLAFFGRECRLLSITTDRASAYTRHRLETDKVKPATAQKELAALKRILTLAHRAGKLAVRPYIEMPEVRNARTGFFEEPQYRAVRAHLSPDIQPVAEFQYLTGMRTQNVLGLQWAQIDFTAGVMRLESDSMKNGEAWTFPFDVLPPLARLVQAQREHTSRVEKATDRIIPWVFHRQGEPIKDFLTGWHSACKKAGLLGRIPHDFRRTAVRNMERAGVPRSVAMKLSGHRTESVYRRYAIVSEADLRAGVAKLAALHEQTPKSPSTVIPLARGQSLVKVRARTRHAH